MSKLLALSIDDFKVEINSNWSKWKPITTIKDLSTFMINNSLTAKAQGTLLSLGKDQLREICINGDIETPQAKEQKVHSTFADEFVCFLEDIKEDIHKSKFNPFVKKMMSTQITKFSQNSEIDIIEKWGFVGTALTIILVIFELIFKDGYKGIKSKFDAFRAKRKQENDARE